MTALRFQTLDASGAVLGTIDFLRKEVTDVEEVPKDRSFVQESQSHKPTLFVRQGNFLVFEAQIRIHGASTEGKLNNLRNHTKNGLGVRIYPKYYQDESINFDGFILPNMPVLHAFSGESSAGKIVTITFMQTDLAYIPTGALT